MEDTSSEESAAGTPPDPSKKQKGKPKRSMRRHLKTFSFGKWQKGFHKSTEKSGGKKRTFSLSKEGEKGQSCSSVASEASSVEGVTCICTGYRRTKAATTVQPEEAPAGEEERDTRTQQAVDASAVVHVSAAAAALSINEMSIGQLTLALQEQLRIQPSLFHYSHLTTAHTQVDYVHHLVPDLRGITHCGFYWGKMDRYVAERTLDKRPEGTFLLRDSAQEEFLFSVSFRRYGRTLHARIEQLHPNRFSFDAHDPSVFTAPTVRQLVEHYKNPSCCMFFEPMLTLPVPRDQPFPLQHLCRAVVADCTTYDGLNSLPLPRSLKGYCKEYHYRQRVRVRHLDEPPYA